MVPSERKPRTCDANECAKQQVESKVSEISEARACDVDGGADGYEDENQSVDWRRGVLVADGYHGVVVVRSRRREGRLLLVDGEDALLFQVGRGNGGGVGRVRGEGAGWEEGDCDGELGSEKECEVEEACP